MKRYLLSLIILSTNLLLAEENIYQKSLHILAVQKQCSVKCKNPYVDTFNKITPYYFKNIDSKFSISRIQKFDDVRIKTIYESIRATAFYSFLISKDESAINKAVLLFDLLYKRKLTTIKDASDLHLQLIKYGKFKESEAFRAKYLKDNQALPAIENIEMESESELQYFSLVQDGENKSLKINNFKISKKPQIIIVGGCHFADDAINELVNYKSISSIIKTHGMVITPPDEFDLNKIKQMNEKFPEYEPHPVFKAYSWHNQKIDLYKTPNFYFIKNSKIVFSFSGAKKILPQFCQGLIAIGFKDVESCNSI